MTDPHLVAELPSRAVVALGGPDWRGFLQGLITQDVETLAPGEARFGGLLTPQGRLLFDLFVIGRGDGCLIDCAADRQDALIQRLTMYRLRAKVEIAASDLTVEALWRTPVAPPGWSADPRLAALGFRGYGAAAPDEAVRVPEVAHEAHRFALGVPGSADWADETTYPIEADFDLLNGIDFKKGCFVGQETTSRMKRRGTVKSRMVPIAFEGAPPDHGAELLAGSLRAGVALSGAEGAAMALLRQDRLEAGALTLADGRTWRPVWQAWLKAGRDAAS
ncbi:MAG: folate-binding protein [Pseudomonadota bacterium]|nr:folate-binding protein [Pseudomonadota bacterium]